MCTNKPRSKDRAYDLKKTSHVKLEITQVFSIADTDFKKKSTTKMISCNGQKNIRIHGKKSGKSSSKIPGNNPKNQSGRLYTST